MTLGAAVGTAGSCAKGRPLVRISSLITAALLPGFSLGMAGCAPKNNDVLHFLREHEHQVSAIEYRVGIPDALAITAPRILEIDGESQRIRPDGKISLRLLGDVKVVGMTAKEIAAKLEVLLSRYYADPKVDVRVVSYESKKYYIYGMAGGVGPRPYTGRDTLFDAVIKAGTNFLSWTSRVRVVRPAHGDTPVRIIEVDIDKMAKTGDWSKNILLEPDDIVYIPPTPGGWIGLRVREVLYPVAPVAHAYVTPAQLEDAYDEYHDDDEDSGGSNYYGNYGGY
jgi:polysaccharide export outer membrane protein